MFIVLTGHLLSKGKEMNHDSTRMRQGNTEATKVSARKSNEWPAEALMNVLCIQKYIEHLKLQLV
jgi:hypothetical protein